MLHFSNDGDAEVHQFDGDKGIAYIIAGFEEYLYRVGQTVEGQPLGLYAAYQGEENSAVGAHQIATCGGGMQRITQKMVSVSMVYFLIEWACRFGCLTEYFNIESVACKDGGVVIMVDGHWNMPWHILQVGIFLLFDASTECRGRQ